MTILSHSRGIFKHYRMSDITTTDLVKKENSQYDT